MPENRGSGYSAGVDKSTSFDAFVIQERGYEKKSAFMRITLETKLRPKGDGRNRTSVKWLFIGRFVRRA